MNILLINHYAGSPDMGMEFRPYYLAREWVKMGHRVWIIAGDYSHLRIRNPKEGVDFREEEIDGIQYVWINTGSYEGNGVSRARTMFRFVRKLKKRAEWIAKNWKPDVVIASSTYPLDTYPAQKIAKLANAKYIHEVHDMWPATLYEVGGMSKHNPFVSILQIAENSAYRNCNACVSLLPYAKEYMIEHGLSQNAFYHVPNGIVKEEWDSPQQIPNEHLEILNNLQKEGKFIVGYFGGHALSNCLDTLIDAAEMISDEQVSFVLVGDGVEKNSLMQKAKEKKLDNILFLPPVAKKMIPELVSCFDVVYIGAKDSPLYRFGVCMNKMFDSMMAGQPIIFAIHAPDTLVKEAGCGLIVPPEKPEEIIAAIAQLKAMTKQERRALGDRGRREILEHYTYQKLAEDFVRVMDEC